MWWASRARYARKGRGGGCESVGGDRHALVVLDIQTDVCGMSLTLTREFDVLGQSRAVCPDGDPLALAVLDIHTAAWVAGIIRTRVFPRPQGPILRARASPPGPITSYEARRDLGRV